MVFLNKYLGIRNNKQQTLVLFALIIIIVLVRKGFNFKLWNANLNYILGGIICCIAFYVSVYWAKFKNYKFASIIVLLSILPFFSIINSYTFFDQSPISSIISSMKIAFIAYIYFILHKFKVKESTLLQVFFIISLFIVIVQIVQQFTYPSIYFGGWNEYQMEILNKTEVDIEIRNGIYRFRIMGYSYTFIMLIIFWTLNRIKTNVSLVMLVGIMLVSIYLTLTRQIIISTIITLLYSLFFVNKGTKFFFKSLLWLIPGVIILYYNFDILFNEFIIKTSNDATSDNIRIATLNYFWNDYIKSPLTILFGYGMPGSSGAYHDYIDRLARLGFYDSDIGILGYAWKFGLLYVVICFYTYYLLFFKYKDSCPQYIKLYIVFKTIMSPMIFPFYGEPNMLFTAFLLYICDLHINKSPLALHLKI